MYLDEESVGHLQDWWVSELREGERELVREFLETLENETWRTRWYALRDLAGSPHAAERWNIWLSDGLLAITDLHVYGEPGRVSVTLVRLD